MAIWSLTVNALFDGYGIVLKYANPLFYDRRVKYGTLLLKSHFFVIVMFDKYTFISVSH